MIHPITVIVKMAESLGLPKKDLLVLAPANDPFNSGTATDRVMGEWFSGLLEEYKLPPGKHLRRWHYLLSTLEKPPIMPDGEAYANTEACWSFLQQSSKHARYQGLVDPSLFADSRNPDAQEWQADPRDNPCPSWEIDHSVWNLPRISQPESGCIYLPDISVSGYDYDDGDQPYHLECWIEKSGADDELDPICREFRVTKKQGVGFDSVTSVIKLLERCQAFIEMDRPVRIFYMSDFDPAGFFMPQAIARQIQFWLWRFGRKADIRLKPLLLTKAQVEEFNLPRKMIKASDLRKKNFEERLGEGHVELDALAALHPGVFERIVSEAFADYRDQNLNDQLDSAHAEASTEAEDAWEVATESLRTETEDLVDRINAISDRYLPKVNRLREQMAAELAPLEAEMNELKERADEEVCQIQRNLTIHLPYRPEPEPPAEAEEEEWLYDSTRSYGEQVNYFHDYKNGELE